MTELKLNAEQLVLTLNKMSADEIKRTFRRITVWTGYYFNEINQYVRLISRCS